MDFVALFLEELKSLVYAIVILDVVLQLYRLRYNRPLPLFPQGLFYFYSLSISNAVVGMQLCIVQ
jgi:hypothetical protein